MTCQGVFDLAQPLLHSRAHSLSSISSRGFQRQVPPVLHGLQSPHDRFFRLRPFRIVSSIPRRSPARGYGGAWGDVPSRSSVSVSATDCGYVFSDGERYLVFATPDGQTNMWMGNVRGAIEPATYGVQAITTYPAQPLDDTNSGRLALAAAMVVLALGAVAAIRMRRSRPA